MKLWPWEVHCNSGVHQGLLPPSSKRENSTDPNTDLRQNFTAFWVCLWAGLVAQHPVPGWARQQHSL